MMIGELGTEESNMTGKLLLVFWFVGTLQFSHSLNCLFYSNLLFVYSVNLSFSLSLYLIWNLIFSDLWEILTTLFKYTF
jgi:hypothetical protein